MNSEQRIRWLLIASLSALAVFGVWRVRHWLFDSTHERLVKAYQQRLIALPEHDAARQLQRLAQDADQWLEILVWASADERALVSYTAERELQDRVGQWPDLEPLDASVRAARLAHALTAHAAAMPPERRHLAHSLAQRLIRWPVDGRHVDAARFIADCQSVLLLPIAEPEEIRVAAAPKIRTAEPALAPPQPALQQPVPDSQPSPQPPEASPAEPRPFIGSPGLRISDD